MPPFGSNAGRLLIMVAAVACIAQWHTSLYATSITIGIYSLLAVPLGLIYGLGGILSLAQGAFAALGAYSSAILFTRLGLSPAATLLPAILIPAAFAYVVSRPILRLPEMSMALATLALGLIIEVAFSASGRVTGGYEGMTGLPPIPFVGGSRIGVFLLVWLAVALSVYCYDAFRASARGRALIAIHVDRLLAESVGVSVARELSLLFAIAGAMSGFAGWLYAHYLGYIGPGSLTVHLSADLLFMVVVGGRSFSLGPVLGATFFVLASDVLPGSAQAQGMFFGASIILVLLTVPEGLLSIFVSRFIGRLPRFVVRRKGRRLSAEQAP
jgi:branched-chain amino acid transport system permease protein